MISLTLDGLDHAGANDAEAVTEILETARRFLGMDIAFIIVDVDDNPERMFLTGRVSDAPAQDTLSLADQYCDHIARGNLPPLIPDTADMPLTTRTAFTTGGSIRSIVACPLQLQTAHQKAMLCCYAHAPRHTFNQRDLTVISALSKLAGKALSQYLGSSETRATAAARVRRVIDTSAFDIFLHPIVSLSDHMPMAAEALCRFEDDSFAGPLHFFRLAAQADMSLEMELSAIRMALGHLPALPDRMYLTLNAGPETVCAPELLSLLSDVPPDRVVIELTEHEAITDLARLTASIRALRHRRIGLAIDDVGAGYAGLCTVLQLQPDVLKLDRELVCNIEHDPAKKALTRAMVHFAQETNAFLVAEGVETAPEHATLRELGVRLGQGFLYGRPRPAAEQMALMHMQRQANPARHGKGDIHTRQAAG